VTTLYQHPDDYWKVLVGDARIRCSHLQTESVDLTLTSVPYMKLRDYQVDGQIGLERIPQELVRVLVDGVFRNVHRATKKRGALIVNVGDSYAHASGKRTKPRAKSPNRKQGYAHNALHTYHTQDLKDAGLKVKDLIGFPWMLAFALRDQGWYLRNEIIWHKTNITPEPPRGRFGVDHEQLFFFTKHKYFDFDHDAVREITGNEATWEEWEAEKKKKSNKGADAERMKKGYRKRSKSLTHPLGRLRRTVWKFPAWGHPDAGNPELEHCATFPPELPMRCIPAACPEGGLVLDPFSGMGTTGVVANHLKRQYLGVELNPVWAKRSAYWLENGYGVLMEACRKARRKKRQEAPGQLTLFDC
jgi:DNA modification methylase